MLIAQWDQIGQPGWIGTIALIAILLSVATAIFLLVERYLKLYPELAKLRSDAIKSSADTLQQLQEKRGLYQGAVDTLAQHAVELRDALEADKRAGLDQLREACCQCLCKDVLAAHINYVEFEQLYHRGDPDSLSDFILDDLVKDIDRFTDRVRLMNYPKLLDRIEGTRNPLVITRQSIKPWYRIATSLPPDRQEHAKEELWKHIGELLKVSGDYPK